MKFLNNLITKLNKKQNLFLTGGAGVGKTTITQEIIKDYEENGKKVAKLASTGMAATLIGGQTLHSFFDFGIASNVEDLQQSGKYEAKKKIKKLLSRVDLIVIDEISMVSDTLLEMVELRLNQGAFSGAVLVVGDFLQLPPVVKGFQSVSFAFESKAWAGFEFETVVLEHIYRTDDKHFIELLHNVRFGHIDENVHNQLNAFIKPLPQDLSQFTFLFGKNISANRHNREQLEHIDGEYFEKDVQIVKHIKSTKEYEIEKFLQESRVESSLALKIGAPVLFTKNSWNYFNGERGIVVNYDSSYIYVQKSDAKIVKLEPVALHKNVWKEKSVDGKKEMVEEAQFSVYYYPIKLAFAITIHKSQGMSIEDLIIETNEIFAPSQFYVALSRSSNPKRLTLIAPRGQWYERIYVNSKAIEFVKSSQK